MICICKPKKALIISFEVLFDLMPMRLKYFYYFMNAIDVFHYADPSERPTFG